MAIHEIDNNPMMAGQVRLIEDIVYTAEDGEALKMDVLAPWAQRVGYLKSVPKPEPRPLIVFVQGSSWRRPTMGEQIPELVQFVHYGYVVATVQHRNSLDGHPFPAFLEDVKTAIRFLRKHADEYCIDPKRVVVWGTSSGANAALLTGLTINDPRYESDSYTDQSDAVSAVVSCFGPTDVEETFEHAENIPGSDILQICLFGTDTKKWPQIKQEMSPVTHVKDGQQYPPFLLLHGDSDEVVAYDQMTKMYDRLQAAGASVEAYRVKGANHERDFWSPQIYKIVRQFLDGVVHPDDADDKED